jgi:hypothetical protein
MSLFGPRHRLLTSCFGIRTQVFQPITRLRSVRNYLKIFPPVNTVWQSQSCPGPDNDYLHAPPRIYYTQAQPYNVRGRKGRTFMIAHHYHRAQRAYGRVHSDFVKCHVAVTSWNARAVETGFDFVEEEAHRAWNISHHSCHPMTGKWTVRDCVRSRGNRSQGWLCRFSVVPLQALAMYRAWGQKARLTASF